MKVFHPWVAISLLACAPSYAQQDSPQPDESRVVIEAVECRGNETTSCEFIRRKLRLAPDTTVEADAVQSAQLRLSALPNFETVRVYLEKGSAKGKARLIVEVKEASAIVTELTARVEHLSTRVPGPYATRDDQRNQLVTGRISHQNLFSRQKIGELAVSGAHGSDSNTEYRDVDVSLVYIDPDLFGVERLFGSVNLGVGRSTSESDYRGTYTFTGPYNSHSENDYRDFDAALSIGYRLSQYSYLVSSIAYLKSESSNDNFFNGILISHYENESDATIGRLGYGWDSEDDAYFPTRGSRLVAGVTRFLDYDCSLCNDTDWYASYKKTWMMGAASIWTVNVGGEPPGMGDRVQPTNITRTAGLGIRYAHTISPTDGWGGIRRGRWYLQLGTGPVELRRDGHIGGKPDQAQVALGIRFESKTLGMVELQATASRFWPRIGG